MAADEGGDPIHPHCLSCVSVTKCSARLEKRTSCQIVHCKLDCGASFHSCKCQEHQLLCPNVKVPCANAINGCPVWLLRSQVGSHLQHCPASLVYCTAEWNRWGWLGDTTNEPHCVDRSGKLQLDFALAMRDLRSLRNDSHFGKLCRGSRDDRMPVATAPVFRRDEYAWHYQNVHRDIHCGLNGWLEHRCPLAQYGCSFSRRRFHPVPSGSQLVYNEVLESFGLAFPSALEGRESGGKDDMEEQVRGHLANGHSYTNGACDESSTLSAALNGPAFSDFPFEVLQHIAAYLDAFSLNNFSLVSKRLRDVSCSLLKSRGMVDFRWEKCGTGGWRVRSKSWYFSNGFTPVRQWAFSDEENMSSHLRKCSYFDRNVKTMPTAVCFGIGNSRGPKTLLHLAL
ncbi:uncharacterized protein LOC144110736 isoform X2 [Amblyomma americanum]